MEDNRFSRRVKHLVIGGYTVACSRGDLVLRAEIPFAGMAFYQPEPAGAEPDLVFRMENTEPDSSGRLLFGSDDFMFPTFLYQRDSGCFDWITRQQDRSPGLAFRISPDWRVFTLYADGTASNGARAFREFGSLFSYAVLPRGGCVLHGVAMEYRGKGILVTAAAGTGKTTHTRMWRDRKNALILNGDRALCRKVDGRWYTFGMPWAGSSGEYINRRAPLACIVCLKRGAENTVRPLSVFDGTIGLMQRIFAPVWPGELQNAGFACCEALAREVPILELSCRPEPQAVEVLAHALESYGV